MTWGLPTAVSTLIALVACPTNPPGAATSDAISEVMRLGWLVVDPGPPLRFRTKDGVLRVEVAVAELGQPRGGDEPIRWAKTKLAGRRGAFGPLGDCRGKLDFPNDNRKVTAIDCSVPPGPDGPRQGSMFVVKTAAGLQVIGVVAPASVTSAQINYKPLIGLVAEGGGAGITARAARTAIAMFMGRQYYLAPDAGPADSSIEGVYHYWHWEPMVNSGMIDTGADYVLFKNGEVWRSPGAAPLDIDPTKFKEARWNDWGSWRRAGATIGITMNGQAAAWVAPNQFVRYDPAGANQRVEGRWTWSRGSSSGSTNVVTDRSITLHADGRFEQTGFSGAFSTDTGTRRAGWTTGWSVGAPAAAQGGHYRINGYALKVTYDDGRRDSALFYWAPGSDGRFSMLVINGTQYLGGGRSS